MKKIVLVGGGGHAKVIVSIVKKTHAYDILGYTDPNDNGRVQGISYLGDDSVLPEIKTKVNDCNAAIGIGNITVSTKRQTIFHKIRELQFVLPAIISPAAIINEDITIAEAAVVFDGVVINSGATIGAGVILNTNSTIEHDCVISDFAHVAPGAVLCGGVMVGRNSFIGAGSTVIQNITIGSDCMIGAGSVVTKSCPEPGLYYGNPARKIR